MEMTCGTVLCDVFHENMVHRSEVKHMLQRLGVPRIDAYDPISWEQALKARRDGDTVGDRGES
jgi:hypothetical protein